MQKVQRQATALFCASKAEADLLNQEFGSLVVLRKFYQSPTPALHLGTLVFALVEREFKVCVQPLCDSVRTGAFRPFPFLPPTEDSEGELVVEHPVESRLVTLKLSRNPYELSLRSFSSHGQTEVWATRGVRGAGRGSYGFTDLKRRRLVWVGELREDFAQRVAFQLGQQFARVGVDEPEFLRRQRIG